MRFHACRAEHRSGIQRPHFIAVYRTCRLHQICVPCLSLCQLIRPLCFSVQTDVSRADHCDREIVCFCFIIGIHIRADRRLICQNRNPSVQTDLIHYKIHVSIQRFFLAVKKRHAFIACVPLFVISRSAVKSVVTCCNCFLSTLHLSSCCGIRS